MKPFIASLLRIREIVIPFGQWEMFLMRLFCSLHFYDTLPQRVTFATMPFPHGLARMIDFTVLAEPGLWPVLKGISVFCLIAYTLGRFSLPALTYLVALIVSFGTLRNSQGAIGHSTQLLALVMLAQWGMSLIDLIAKPDKATALWKTNAEGQRRMIHAARVMMAAAYLTTAISKIDRSNGRWLMDIPNLSVQIVKTQANDYYNTLEPIEPPFAKELPDLIAEHPNLARLFFAPGLLIELFFFLGLLGRRWSAGMGLAAIGLHRSIELLMGLSFESHEVLLWIFFVNVPYWIAKGASMILKRLQPLTTRRLRMNVITLFYDADCGICTACVDWLARQAKSAGAKLIVIAYQDEKLIEKYAVIDRRHADLGIQTLDSNGQVCRDASAVAACLRNLQHWRWLGICMDWLLLKTAFQTGYRLVANNRQTLSRWFGLQACRIPVAVRKSDAVVSE